jgi:uncharacterized protein
MDLDASSVADYLRRHPEFFDQHLDLLAEVRLPHPHEGHAIPITERQLLHLRERTRELEQKLRELIRFGGENDRIGENLHRLTLALLAAPDAPTVVALLHHSLERDFGIERAALRLFDVEAAEGLETELAPTDPQTCSLVDALVEPYCGAEPLGASASWFTGEEPLQGSFAVIPLRSDRTFGALALASPDPSRFRADMGRLYLTRLGEIGGMALARALAIGPA